MYSIFSIVSHDNKYESNKQNFKLFKKYLKMCDVDNNIYLSLLHMPLYYNKKNINDITVYKPEINMQKMPKISKHMSYYVFKKYDKFRLKQGKIYLDENISSKNDIGKNTVKTVIIYFLNKALFYLKQISRENVESIRDFYGYTPRDYIEKLFEKVYKYFVTYADETNFVKITLIGMSYYIDNDEAFLLSVNNDTNKFLSIK